MDKFKALFASPITILVIASLAAIILFSMPDHIGFLLGDIISLFAYSVTGIALMLLGVFVSRFARAAFNNGDANGSTRYVVPAVYLSCALVVAGSIIAISL